MKISPKGLVPVRLPHLVESRRSSLDPSSPSFLRLLCTKANLSTNPSSFLNSLKMVGFMKIFEPRHLTHPHFLFHSLQSINNYSIPGKPPPSERPLSPCSSSSRRRPHRQNHLASILPPDAESGRGWKRRCASRSVYIAATIIYTLFVPRHLVSRRQTHNIFLP